VNAKTIIDTKTITDAKTTKNTLAVKIIIISP
jgi:hypothetical protein